MFYRPVTQKQIAECYQELFEILSNEHGLILLEEEMDEIISASRSATEKLEELYRALCDVEGCDHVPCNGGTCWRETGYWCVCLGHSNQFRNGEPQPKMRDEAVLREESRLPDGTLPVHELTSEA